MPTCLEAILLRQTPGKLYCEIQRDCVGMEPGTLIGSCLSRSLLERFQSKGKFSNQRRMMCHFQKLLRQSAVWQELLTKQFKLDCDRRRDQTFCFLQYLIACRNEFINVESMQLVECCPVAQPEKQHLHFNDSHSLHI